MEQGPVDAKLQGAALRREHGAGGPVARRRSDPRRDPVMFISSTDHLADRLRAFSAGGVDYVVKPFQPDEILARIETHLSLRGWQRALEERVRERTADLVEANVRLREEAAERRRTEATLRESAERYRALYEDTPSMYFTVDPAGTVLSVNSFGATQLGYTVDELVGGSVLRVFPEDQQAEAVRTRRGPRPPGPIDTAVSWSGGALSHALTWIPEPSPLIAWNTTSL